ncbi:MAG: NADAR family protein [Polyangiales bacterium]
MTLPTELKAFQAAARSGKRFKYVFFWGHRPKRAGVTDSACFSNWFAAPFTVEGIRYASAEHYMMAGKARLFGDADALQRILGASSPGAAKRFGREVRGFDEETWVAERSRIVEEGVHAKFAQNGELRAFLVATKKRVLVEASPKDRIWGIGLSADDERAANPLLWNGLNLLGFALMRARRALVEEPR